MAGSIPPCTDDVAEEGRARRGAVVGRVVLHGGGGGRHEEVGKVVLHGGGREEVEGGNEVVVRRRSGVEVGKVVLHGGGGWCGGGCDRTGPFFGIGVRRKIPKWCGCGYLNCRLNVGGCWNMLLITILILTRKLEITHETYFLYKI